MTIKNPRYCKQGHDTFVVGRMAARSPNHSGVCKECNRMSQARWQKKHLAKPRAKKRVSPVTDAWIDWTLRTTRPPFNFDADPWWLTCIDDRMELSRGVEIE